MTAIGEIVYVLEEAFSGAGIEESNEGQSLLRALRDEDLATPRPTNWGELRETRWLISTIAQHDVSHAGEVNHLQSILASTDDWRWG